MKYSVVCTGVVGLASHMITHSSAASLPRNSTTAVIASESGAQTTSKGPAFPATLYYSGKNGTHRRRSLELWRPGVCDGIDWIKHGKMHCAAKHKGTDKALWPCYRKCLKLQLGLNEPLNPKMCKHTCMTYDRSGMDEPDCSTTSDDEHGCTIPELRKEIEYEMKGPKDKKIAQSALKPWTEDTKDKDKEEEKEKDKDKEKDKEAAHNALESWKGDTKANEVAQNALEPWTEAMPGRRESGSPSDEKPKLNNYLKSHKNEDEDEDEQEVSRKALEQWLKMMGEGRKNGAVADEKPEMNKSSSAKNTEDKVSEALERRKLRSVEEWRKSRGQVYQGLNEKRGYKFNCSGEEVWAKNGKGHCASPGRWPCFGACLRDTVLNHDHVRSGKCKKFCKSNGNLQPGDCTTSSDDDFGCNLPRLLNEVKLIEEAQNPNKTETATISTDVSKTSEALPRTTQDPELLISQLGESTRMPEPTGAQ